MALWPPRRSARGQPARLCLPTLAVLRRIPQRLRAAVCVRTTEPDVVAGTPQRKLEEVRNPPICNTVMQSLSWVAYLTTRACLCCLDADIAQMDVGNCGLDFSIPENASWLESFAVFWANMSIREGQF